MTMATQARCKRSVIFGPPGTGKTREVLSRAGRLLEGGADPEGILFISHTRSAASEIRERVKLRNVSTLHALCYHSLSLTKSLVVNPSKLSSFARAAHIEANGEKDSDLPGDQMLSTYMRAVARRVDPMVEYDNSTRPGNPAHYEYIWKAYEAWKSEFGFFDFNDMLEQAAELGPGNYQHIFVDEAQDLSPLQWQVVEALSKKADSVTIAGDDDQAIFIWGGADPAGMARWADDYNADVTILDQSYRVPAEVHWLAESIRDRIGDSVDKTYRAAPHHGSFTRWGSLDVMPDEVLIGGTILYRDLTGRLQIEQELDARKISFTASGGGRGTRYQSRQARALRIIDRMKRGITIEERDMRALRDVLRREAMDNVTAGNAEWLFDRVPSEILEGSWEDLDYFDAVDVTKPAQVEISTIHGAKGNEWDKVVLLSQMSERVAREFAINPDAEHRVVYVGVTRARHDLHFAGGDNEYPLP